MTVTQTLRFLLKKYGSGSDPHPTRAEHNAMIDQIENNAAMGAQGITGGRPAAGKGRRFFWDTTVGRMFYDDGANWQDLNPNGGGGAGTKVVPAVAASEGISAKAARADHTHTIDLATGAAHGAMSAADKAKLDASTSAATASAIARRDAAGKLSVATPTDGTHATTKAYVDSALNNQTHDASDITSGVLTAPRLPVSSALTAGSMSAADKALLDTTTQLATGDSIARRDSGGRLNVAAPTAAAHATTKAYVDSALASQTHDASAITSGVLGAARLPASSPTTAGSMSAADKALLDTTTQLATGNSIARRDASGRLVVATPTTASHATTKAYVDGQIVELADYVDAQVGDWAEWQAYTPVWGGFASVGSGSASGGTFAVIAPGIVRAHAWLRIGAGGGSFSPGFQNVSLPHPPAGYERQAGDGLTMKGSISGPTTMIKLATGSGVEYAQMYAWPTPNGYMQTLQAAGLILAAGDEIHVNMTYRASIS